MLNPFFNAPYTVEGEADLYESLLIESIQAVGVDYHYLIRDSLQVNQLGEADLESFKNSFVIEAQILEAVNFSGEADLFSPFGFSPSDTCKLLVSIARFQEEASDYKIIIPKEGDLMYSPMTKEVWEIRRVDMDGNYFIAGKRYCYIVNCAIYQPGHANDDFQPEDFIFNEPIGSPTIIGQDETDRITTPVEQDALEKTDFDANNPFKEYE